MFYLNDFLPFLSIRCKTHLTTKVFKESAICPILIFCSNFFRHLYQSEEAETAILVAASNKPTCCQVLIDAGADVNVAFNVCTVHLVHLTMTTWVLV